MINDKNENEKHLHIIYVSTLCSAETYNVLFGTGNHKILPQAQKYHRLMTEGLTAHKNVIITVISAPPITRQTTNKILFRKNISNANGINYQMVGTLNIPVFRRLFTLFGAILSIWRISKKDKNPVFICDALNITISIAALFTAWIKGIKTVGIVTDAPECLYTKSSRWSVFMTRLLLNRFSAYLALTEQINDIVNTRGRPYIVIEGHTDSRLASVDNKLSEKNNELICLYTGSLRHNYGINILAEAFLLADIHEAILRIHGMGDFEDELAELAKKHGSIRFGGMVPNEQIVDEQIKATLLINPRPTDQEFTKYSFPSKNMEYIASGTPLLTTKLPGMPDEYLPHVYLFEEETVEGYAKTLREVLSLPREELHAKGLAAKEFAMREKNNVVQAGKLLKMIREQVLPGQ